jgi:hypothetical protein
METSDSTLKKFSCKQKDCPFSKNGTCLEDLSIEECPHLYLQSEYHDDLEEENYDDEDNVTTTETKTFITLDGCDDLSISDISKVTHNFKANLIVVFGESDSGKTTLGATIHELFQQAPFKKYWFAGSMTPIGFEKRCYLSRLISGSEKARTQKTKAGELRFLHIALKEETKLEEKANHLIISDASGEIYKLARNSSDYMKGLTLLKRASNIVITLDGEKLANNKLRNVEIVHSKVFIKKALEEEIFDIDTRLNLVITKWDKLRILEKFSLEDLISQYSEILNNKVKEFKYTLIAARPDIPTAEIPFGFGIDKLLDDWINSSEVETPILRIDNEVFNSYKRQFQKVLSYKILED